MMKSLFYFKNNKLCKVEVSYLNPSTRLARDFAKKLENIYGKFDTIRDDPPSNDNRIYMKLLTFVRNYNDNLHIILISLDVHSDDKKRNEKCKKITFVSCTYMNDPMGDE